MEETWSRRIQLDLVKGQAAASRATVNASSSGLRKSSSD